MTDTVLVAGTASHVGKSTVVAGLCRVLARRGRDVAPYKAQNMSNNARVALTPEGQWGELGVSQHVQARAAEITPTTDLNPVLLKPRGDCESQLIIDGEAVGHLSTDEYYEDHWETARTAAVAAYHRLAARHEVVIAEGAGSIAEINLHDRDLANVETPHFADARIVVLVDIERGGAFASLYGTLALLPAGLRDRVAGAIITKFRGDRSLLAPGIAEIEDRTGVPILGVLPWAEIDLPAEDSVELPEPGDRGVRGDADGVPPDRAITIGVPRLPRISNFTDLEPLARTPGVRVVYLPVTASLDGMDAVVLPGSKNTVDDLAALKRTGMADRLRAFHGPMVGLCGGYQLLGERLTNAHREGTTEVTAVDGLGLLPVSTRYGRDKNVEAVTRRIEGTGPLAGATGHVTGYEIHLGRTELHEELPQPLGGASAATDRVLGTYLHGLFDNGNARRAFVEHVFARTDRSAPAVEPAPSDPFGRAADLVADHVDLEALFTAEPSGVALRRG